MHSYNGIEHKYKSSDYQQISNSERINKILGFVPSTESLNFDLSFYSGGSGVFDRLAINCIVNSEQWVLVIDHLNLHPPQSILLIEHWVEDFVWLIEANDNIENINKFSADFINNNKREFQDKCLPTSDIYFSYASDVNHWVAIWGNEKSLNYLYSDQG